MDFTNIKACFDAGKKTLPSILTENRQPCPSSYTIRRSYKKTESFYFLSHFRYTVNNRLCQSRRLLMELLFHNQEECHRIEVYNEYLKKIPELLKQLETVETMYQKALLEQEMMQEKDTTNHSVQLYNKRLESICRQCEERSLDIRQQCRLILELKTQIENESSVLKQICEITSHK